MMVRWLPWIMVAGTVLLTAYGQLVLKWQAGQPSPWRDPFLTGLPPMVQLLLRPWVVSAFIAAFGASLCWILALKQLDLSKAYPFMALNFLLVSLLAVPLFGETLTFNKLTGMGALVIGLILISRG